MRNPSPFQPLPSTSCFPHSISLTVPGCCRSHGEPRTFQEEESRILLVPVFEVGGSLYNGRHLTNSPSPLSLRGIKEPQFPAPFDCTCGFSRVPTALLDSEGRAAVLVFSASTVTLTTTSLDLPSLSRTGKSGKRGNCSQTFVYSAVLFQSLLEGFLEQTQFKM